MAKVDLLLARLEKMNGEMMLLATGQPIQFMIGGVMKPLSPTPLSDADLATLLTEVLPEHRKDAYEIMGRAEFDYVPAAGPTASVLAEHTGKKATLKFVLTPLEEAAVIAEAPPPVPAVDMSLPEDDGSFELERPPTIAGDRPPRERTRTSPGTAAASPPSGPGEEMWIGMDTARDFELDANAAAAGVELETDLPTAINSVPPEIPPDTFFDQADAQWGTAPSPAATAKTPVPKPTAPPAPVAAPAKPAPRPPPPSAAIAPANAQGRTAAIKQLVALLRTLVEWKGSDLHISASTPPRIRVHGRLEAIEGAAPVAPELVTTMVEAILDDRQRARFHEEHAVDFAFDLDGVGRFRANAVRHRLGASLVFRSIPSVLPTFEELGLPKAVEGLTKFPNGLVLVTGPAGCGKSTTLATILDRINETWADHIITVEDPIEFVHPAKACLVNQREVGAHVRSFAEALKSALREDPDVIMVGELRDLETIQLAITAAETGHLVLGTLHTVDAGRTVDRLIDVFPGAQKAQIRGMVSESIRGVISQQLVPTADGQGVVAAFEVLLADRSISNLIREAKTFQIPNAMKLGRARGMLSMDDSLAALVASGKITAEVAIAHSESPEALKKSLGIGKAVVPGTAAAPATASGKVPAAAPPKGATNAGR